MVSKRKVFKIFYSSETGTAKKYAREALDLLNMSFKTEMFPLNEKEATFESLSDSDVAIIIVSTFENSYCMTFQPICNCTTDSSTSCFFPIL